MLFIAREGKCGAKRREKFDCWACQHQFLVNNNHSKARCTQELLLLRLKSLLLLCVLAGWFLQERKEREANEQQQREAPRKIPRCVSCVTSISGRTTSKQSTTSAKRNMTSCLDRMRRRRNNGRRHRSKARRHRSKARRHRSKGRRRGKAWRRLSQHDVTFETRGVTSLY